MNARNVYVTNSIIVLGFTVFYFFTKNNLFLLPATLVLLCSLINFKIAEKIANMWMLVGKKIGGFNARIMLSVLFIVLITPISLLRKLKRPKQDSYQSNWKAAADTIDFTRPF